MIPSSFRDLSIHLTGVKGTGMAALAEILHDEGARLSGSDVGERFFTDDLLARIGLVPTVGFSPDHVPTDASLLVYSSAYDQTNPERAEASRRGLPQHSYTEMLGALSRTRRSLAISGVHGKTSTTAMVGTLIAGLDLPATVVVGSAVPSFGGSATLRRGTEYLVAETCEYRRHFLDFSPDVLVVTSVEADHLDYYRDYDDVLDAFVAFARRLPQDGVLVYCADDPGATAVATKVEAERPGVRRIPYGFSVTGPGRIGTPRLADGRQEFEIELPSGSETFELAVPGRHMVANAAAAVMALSALVEDGGDPGRVSPTWRRSLAAFAGTSRRSEILGEFRGILVVDDYAHHPTAIRTTLAGFREFWPGRRIVVDFMSHTYSRTMALLDEFADAFGDADVLFLNDIYASARESRVSGFDGARFAETVRGRHGDVRFVPDFSGAADRIMDELRRGDIFVTMGAGDNFRISRDVADRLRQREGET
jgi:UDP-N-acetylmuramate--alanine ligase